MDWQDKVLASRITGFANEIHAVKAGTKRAAGRTAMAEPPPEAGPLVRRGETRPSLAPHERSLRHHGFGNHASADPGHHRHSLLRTMAEGIPFLAGAGGGAGKRRP